MTLLLLLLLTVFDGPQVKLANSAPGDSTLALASTAVIGPGDWGVDYADNYPGALTKSLEGVSITLGGEACDIWAISRGNIWFVVPPALPTRNALRQHYYDLVVKWKYGTLTRRVLVLPYKHTFNYWYGERAHGPVAMWQNRPGQIANLMNDAPAELGPAGVLVGLKGTGFGVPGQPIQLTVGGFSVDAWISADPSTPGQQYLMIKIPAHFPTGCHLVDVKCRGIGCGDKPAFGIGEKCNVASVQ